MLRGVWRVRWLLLAVFVLFVFFTPGEGVPWFAAVARTAVLVCAVAAVQFALYGVPAHELADGLARFVGARFARRLVATLDAVPEVQAMIAETAGKRDWFDRAATVFARIEADTDAQNRRRS